MDPLKITLRQISLSSATMNGYGRFSFGYQVSVNGGYGEVSYKYELLKGSMYSSPVSTIDFTEETGVSVSYTGYEDTINEYIYKISAKDEVGNLSVYWFNLGDCSVINYEDRSQFEHSYENGTCVCGRDITADAVEIYDLSENQDGSVVGYLLNTNDGQKLYILGNGDTKNYLNYGDNVTPFKSNKTITEVYIGEGITSIGDRLFYFCSGLQTVNIPDGVTYIGENAFEHCNLSSIVLPEGLRKIGDDAFYHNSKLGEIVFPQSLEYIGDDAFCLCDLTKIYIPKNVSYIGDGAFSYNDLCEISVDKDNSRYCGVENCIVDKTTKTLVTGCRNSVIPADGSVICIGAQAFSGSGLPDIKIPSCIVEIGRYAFSGCDLKSVIIPTSVNKIGYGAFYGCDSLTTIYCEASERPTQWDADWNKVNSYQEKFAEVVWSYEG